MQEIKFALKDARKRKKITQLKLSDITGIHQQQISRYERNTSIPSLEVAVRIADALGVTLDELVSIREAHEQVGKKLIKLSKKLDK